MIGSVYEGNTIDFKNKTSNFTTQAKNHKLFIVTIDSLGDVAQRVEKVFPLPIQTKTQTGLQSFHLKIREFKKTQMVVILYGQMYMNNLYQMYLAIIVHGNLV